jgi:quinol monooxygenase YgiN
MWAQAITGRLKPGKTENLPRLIDQLRAAEHPDSGLVRTMVMRHQNDPAQIYLLMLFESEEQALALENDPRRQSEVNAVRDAMAEVFEGRPEYAGLTIVEEWTG